MFEGLIIGLVVNTAAFGLSGLIISALLLPLYAALIAYCVPKTFRRPPVSQKGGAA